MSRTIIDGEELVSFWDDPEKHKIQVERLIQQEAQRLGISYEELMRRENEKLNELEFKLKFRMFGAGGGGFDPYYDPLDDTFGDLKMSDTYKFLKRGYDFIRNLYLRYQGKNSEK